MPKRRSTVFWAATICCVLIAGLFIGSQIAHDRGQNVDWYTGFGQWLGALGSFIAAGAALWISMTDRRRSDADRQRTEAQQNVDLTRQAGLVRVTAERLAQRQAVGPGLPTASIGIRNRRSDRIFDVEVVEFVHESKKMDLPIAQVNGFAIFPRREAHENRFPMVAELPGLTLDIDEWLVIYQPDHLPNTPADYVAVEYTDSAGRRWRVDTEGTVTRL